jgi:hypothetical protein
MKATKNTPKVKLDIRIGLVSPAQKAAGRKFWQRLIASVKSKVKSDE